MYISVNQFNTVSKKETSRAVKSCRFYAGAALFFAVFGAIYEVFSHQVYSPYMMFAFAIPLIGGVIPFAFAEKCRWRLPSPAVTQLYGGGLMALTVGSVMKGVLDIYGTTNWKITFYPIVGGAAILAAVIWTAVQLGSRKQYALPEARDSVIDVR